MSNSSTTYIYQKYCGLFKAVFSFSLLDVLAVAQMLLQLRPPNQLALYRVSYLN